MTLRRGVTNTQSKTVPRPRQHRQPNRRQPAAAGAASVPPPTTSAPTSPTVPPEAAAAATVRPRPLRLLPPRRPPRLMHPAPPERRNCLSPVRKSSRSFSSVGRWWESARACSSSAAGGCTHVGDISIRREQRSPSPTIPVHPGGRRPFPQPQAEGWVNSPGASVAEMPA